MENERVQEEIRKLNDRINNQTLSNEGRSFMVGARTALEWLLDSSKEAVSGYTRNILPD